MSVDVVVYCSSLGRRCGVGAYAARHAAAEGVPSISSLGQLGHRRPTHLHVHHEFGIMPLGELKSVIGYCRRNRAALHVTLHSVYAVPEPLHLWPIRKVAGIADRLRARVGPRLGVQVTAPDRPPPDFLNGWTWFNRTGLLQARRIVVATRLILREADLIVATTQAAGQAVTRMGGRQVTVIPLGCTQYPTSDHRFSREDGKLHVGFFGHLARYKRLLDIIAACDRLDDVVLHAFTTVNDIWPEARYLADITACASSRPWLRLDLEYHPLERIVWYLSQCDVNVWYQEPSDITYASSSIGEYLAAQRPVVAADTAVTRDLTGIVQRVDPYDTAALADAIRNGQHQDTSGMRVYLEQHAMQKLNLYRKV